jgi:hypothetical protein
MELAYLYTARISFFGKRRYQRLFLAFVDKVRKAI